MKYNCIDRGGKRCPCTSGTLGQCYICSGLSRENCNCESWQGVCPFTEFFQNGQEPVCSVPPVITEVISRKTYSSALWVIILKVPKGFAQQCTRPGSFILAEVLGSNLPLSVLKAEYDGSEGRLHLAVKPAGPKTGYFIKEVHSKLSVKGPFFSGLTRPETMDFNKNTLVVARGTAVSPFVNIQNRFQREKVKLLLDEEGLTEKFTKEYIGCIPWESCALAQDLEDIKGKFKLYEQIIFLASPYYVKSFEAEAFICSNNANICCGEGLCGSCSYTDESGTTVKPCKCYI